jgi:hypothetical protein
LILRILWAAAYAGFNRIAAGVTPGRAARSPPLMVVDGKVYDAGAI